MRDGASKARLGKGLLSQPADKGDDAWARRWASLQWAKSACMGMVGSCKWSVMSGWPTNGVTEEGGEGRASKRG